MVDTVSRHVHEQVDPATILANTAKRLSSKDAARQWRYPDLFAAPFENLPLRQALEFYRHEKGWSNRLVAGGQPAGDELPAQQGKHGRSCK